MTKLSWQGGALVAQWTFQSDWIPEPRAGKLGAEPVFHPVLAGGFLYVPGLGGSVHRVSKTTGLALARINPFDDLNPARYVAGGLAADDDGHVIYNADRARPRPTPGMPTSAGAWLVRVGPDDVAAKVDFATLVAGAPGPADACKGQFSDEPTPWPPSSTATPPSSPCGSQRPGLNVVPAVGPGRNDLHGQPRPVQRPSTPSSWRSHPDLTPAWSTSLRGFLNDGCGVLVPIDNTDSGCRTGTTVGVDPATNDRPAGACRTPCRLHPWCSPMARCFTEPGRATTAGAPTYSSSIRAALPSGPTISGGTSRRPSACTTAPIRS